MLIIQVTPVLAPVSKTATVRWKPSENRHESIRCFTFEKTRNRTNQNVSSKPNLYILWNIFARIFFYLIVMHSYTTLLYTYALYIFVNYINNQSYCIILFYVIYQYTPCVLYVQYVIDFFFNFVRVKK